MPVPATRGRAFLLGVYHRFRYFSCAHAKGALYCKNKAMQAIKIIRIAIPTTAAILFCLFFNQVNAAIFTGYENAPIGITLNGAEFGNQNLPGIYKTDYIYPTEQEVRYFAGKGVQLIQLPVRWERVQQKIGGGLDLNQMALINKFIN